MLIKNRYIILFLFASAILSFVNLNAQNSNIESMEDLRQEYDLQTLELENSIRDNENKEKIITCIIISLIITFTLSILLYIQNKKLKRYREKWRVMQISAEIALRNKSTILSNMSHEIKTPLNALIGFSDIISESNDLDDNAMQECNDIIKLNTLQQIKQTDADILFESDIKRLIIKTDPARIQQVLINLLVNATKFCKQGSIILKVEREGDMVYVSVSDNGTGIPLDKQHLVFDRFEKVDEDTHGTGLGLSICKLKVTELKGKIWVDPAYTEGARFIFTLPIVN